MILGELSHHPERISYHPERISVALSQLTTKVHCMQNVDPSVMNKALHKYDLLDLHWFFTDFKDLVNAYLLN